MRKKIKHIRSVPVILAVVIGLFVGLLLIPRIKEGLFPAIKSDVPDSAPPILTPVTVTTAELLDESNWLQYTATGYELNFKYPAKFVTNVFNEPQQDIDLFSGITFGRMKMPQRTLYEQDLAQLGYTISVRIDRARTLKEALAETDIYKDRKGYSKKEIKLLGNKAYQYEGVGLDSYQTRIFFERNKQVYLFMLSRFIQKGEVIDEGEQIFKKMVTSIKFSKN